MVWLKKITKVQASKAYLDTLVKADPSSLCWIADGNHSHTFKIAFAALNTRDVLLASGQLSPYLITGKLMGSYIDWTGIMPNKISNKREWISQKWKCNLFTGNRKACRSLLGLEFSGWDETGCRIMGLSQGNSLATHITPDTKYTWKIPEKW